MPERFEIVITCDTVDPDGLPATMTTVINTPDKALTASMADGAVKQMAVVAAAQAAATKQEAQLDLTSLTAKQLDAQPGSTAVVADWAAEIPVETKTPGDKTGQK